MKKILIIGQAPAAVKQTVPYDTTMLYDWLKECGISKEAAQELFDFEAISNVFPGFNPKGGGHNKPSVKDMDNHWPVLEQKLQDADRVILLGSVAAEYYDSKPRTWSCNLQELYLMHPSKRNAGRYQENKHLIISQIKTFLS